MGFNLDSFFQELFEILNSDIKDSKKAKRMRKVILEAYVYAKECGQIEAAHKIGVK
jgi:hypothetical protein